MTGALDRDWIRRVADGELPDWTEATPKRRAHMQRVAGLLGEWAAALDLSASDQARWRAAGWLHDVLRDADPSALRREAAPDFAHLPDPYLHGPVTAERLRAAGLEDHALLDAITFHTLGREGLDRLGLALIAADYLEPGRPDRAQWRAELRARMPDEFGAVVRAVVQDKLVRALEHQRPVRPEMVDLWNELTGDAGAA